MTINKKKLTPIALISIFFIMLSLSFAAVPLYDLFCRVTGFGGTTQDASNKELPKVIVDQDYKMINWIHDDLVFVPRNINN